MAVAHRQRRRKAQRTRINGNQPVAEIIGRAVTGNAQMSVFRSRAAITTVDQTIPDYAFYDLLRRGKQPGYKLGALFAKRIEHIFAGWTLGRGVDIKLEESGNADDENDPRNYTDGQLADFINANHSLLMTTEEDKYGLGDQYIVVNADGTLSVPSPDTVEVERDLFDYRRVVKVTITTKFKDVVITDEYRADGRTVTIKRGEQEIVQQFQNLTGRIPIIHLAHGMSGNETNGHSIHEDLLALYDQYDDVLFKQLDGAKLLGNPLLAFVGMENLAAVMDANQPATTETYIDMAGNEVNRPQLNIDRNSILLVGKGGDAKFVSPPVGFTADTQQALKTLFLLLLDRTGIPEFIWGNEMSSARASSDTQMVQWSHDIEGLQKANERWLLELCDIWLLTAALTDPQLVVDALAAQWPPLLDENEDMRLKAVDLARRNNLLTDKTTLELLPLPVDDPETEVADAASEATARADQAQARIEAQAKVQANRQPNDGSTDTERITA